MKLIAIKHISHKLPKGSVFEISKKKGRILVAIKAAKEVTDDVEPPPAAAPAPTPVQEPEPAPLPDQSSDDPEPPPDAAPAVTPATEEPKPAPRRGRSSPTGQRPA